MADHDPHTRAQHEAKFHDDAKRASIVPASGLRLVVVPVRAVDGLDGKGPASEFLTALGKILAARVLRDIGQTGAAERILEQ